MWQYVKGYKFKVASIISMIVLRQALLVFAQYLNAETFSVLVAKDWYGFVRVVLFIVVVWVTIIALDKIMTVYEENLVQDIATNMREDISQRMIQTSYDSFVLHSKGQYLSWLNNDVNTVIDKGIRQFFELLRGISGVLFAGFTLIYYHWSLLVVTLVGFLLIMYIPKLFNQSIYSVGQEVTEANEQFISEVEDNLQGYKTYFAYSLLNRFVSSIRTASLYLKTKLMKQVKLESTIFAVNFSINVFFQVLLTLVAGVCYFMGYVVIGAVAAVGSLADIIFSGLGQISFQITSIKSVRPILDKFDTLQKESISKNLSSVSDGAIYNIENLSLFYQDDKVFQHLSLTIEPHKKYLLVGKSGSGKSSLLHIMLGYIRNYEGLVQYGGIDLRNLSSKSIAEAVLYLSQQPHVFTGTVRSNLTLGEQYEESELLQVLTLVGFDDAVKWLDKFVGVQGSELSGGQKQRIALARALLRRPKVLLLDEITSALDKESSIHIEKLLLQIPEVAVVLITHVLHDEVEKYFDQVYTLM